MGVHNRRKASKGDRLFTETGERTRWTAVSDSYPSFGKTYVKVVCDCSNTSAVRLILIERGLSRGCKLCGSVDTRDWPSVGERLGNRTVLAISTQKTRLGMKTMVKVQCDCGKLEWRCLGNIRHAIKQGDVPSCASCRPYKMEKPDIIARTLFHQWRPEMPWLTNAMIHMMCSENCFYCGREPSNSVKTKRKILPNFVVKYQGIDEVVYGKGHTIDNVLPCCITCNKAKGNKNLSNFCTWYNAIRQNEREVTPEKLIAAAKEFGEKLSLTNG